MSKSLIVTTRHVLIVVGMSLGMAFTTPGVMPCPELWRQCRQGTYARRSRVREMHPVQPGTFGIFAADFGEVANLPSTTALSLRVFLGPDHKEIANFSLKTRRGR